MDKVLELVQRSALKPESIVEMQFTPTGLQLVELTQVLFWMKINSMISLNEEIRIMEVFTKFCISFFRPYELAGIDKKTELILKCIWRINFVNENYKNIDAYCKTNNEKSQQWMINLLSMLQECYFELSKTYFKFNDGKVYIL